MFNFAEFLSIEFYRDIQTSRTFRTCVINMAKIFIDNLYTYEFTGISVHECDSILMYQSKRYTLTEDGAPCYEGIRGHRQNM